MVDGLKVLVIGIVYAIPIIVVGLCLGIPAGILSNDNNAFGGVLNALMSCLNLIWAVVLSLLLPRPLPSTSPQTTLAPLSALGR